MPPAQMAKHHISVALIQEMCVESPHVLVRGASVRKSPLLSGVPLRAVLLPELMKVAKDRPFYTWTVSDLVTKPELARYCIAAQDVQEAVEDVSGLVMHGDTLTWIREDAMRPRPALRITPAKATTAPLAAGASAGAGAGSGADASAGAGAGTSASTSDPPHPPLIVRPIPSPPRPSPTSKPSSVATGGRTAGATGSGGAGFGAGGSAAGGESGVGATGTAPTGEVVPRLKLFDLISGNRKAWSQRVWVSPAASGTTWSAATASGLGFTMLSWNILADKEAVKDRTTFQATGPWLDRLPVIIARILSLRCDVLCLQELQTGNRAGVDNHVTVFMSALEAHGYQCIPHMGDRQATTMLCFRRAMFELVGHPIRSVSDLLQMAERSGRVIEHFNRFSTRFVLAMLRHRTSQRLVLACSGYANVPLEGEGRYAHYKPLLDALVTTQAITIFADEFKAYGHMAPAVVWGVDMNNRTSEPAVQYLLQGGNVPREVVASLTEQAERDGRRAPPFPLSPCATYKDAYVVALGHAPAYTNCNHSKGFVGDIDHVFFLPEKLEAVGVLDVYPWSSAIHPDVPKLPNAVVPSDHVPLVVRFALQ